MTGAGALAGADNGKEASAQAHQPTTHAAFNGKVLAIVQAAEHPGSVTITASGAGLVPVTTTLFTVNPEARGLVGAQPAYLRSPLGVTPDLPQTVTGVYADGSTGTLTVDWHTIPAGGMSKPGTVSVSYWDGAAWQAVSGQQVQWATASNQPTTITFDPVSTIGIRLDLTSPAPDTSTGFLQITELQVPADEVTG